MQNGKGIKKCIEKDTGLKINNAKWQAVLEKLLYS